MSDVPYIMGLVEERLQQETPTLRDQFAMAVVKGELASQSPEVGVWNMGDGSNFAKHVWMVTDALLAARDGGEG